MLFKVHKFFVYSYCGFHSLVIQLRNRILLSLLFGGEYIISGIAYLVICLLKILMIWLEDFFH